MFRGIYRRVMAADISAAKSPITRAPRMQPGEGDSRCSVVFLPGSWALEGGPVGRRGRALRHQGSHQSVVCENLSHDCR